jgi:hypothetical protein
MVDELKLRNVHPEFCSQAREAFRDGDPRGFVISAIDRGYALDLVADNLRPLTARGIYEQCLVIAFTNCRDNNRNWSASALDYLFNRADRSALRASGDPLPGQGPFRLYRGIAGMGRARRRRGYSWSSSLNVACWFAMRFVLPSPAVLTAEVKNEDVLAYFADGSEDEFLCKPTQITTVKIAFDEIRARATQQTDFIRNNNAAKFQQWKSRMSDV